MLTWIILALIAAMILWVRVAPSNPTVWHVDPQAVEKTPKPNQFLMRAGQDAEPEQFNLSPSDLAQKIHEMALSKPSVSLLAGDPKDLWMTYVQRTKLMAYPDYISVKIVENGPENAQLYIYSRSRFGRSDLGVNKARITNWLAALR